LNRFRCRSTGWNDRPRAQISNMLISNCSIANFELHFLSHFGTRSSLALRRLTSLRRHRLCWSCGYFSAATGRWGIICIIFELLLKTSRFAIGCSKRWSLSNIRLLAPIFSCNKYMYMKQMHAPFNAETLLDLRGTCRGYRKSTSPKC
jgi:hypothetical protein